MEEKKKKNLKLLMILSVLFLAIALVAVITIMQIRTQDGNTNIFETFKNAGSTAYNGAWNQTFYMGYNSYAGGDQYHKGNLTAPSGYNIVSGLDQYTLPNTAQNTEKGMPRNFYCIQPGAKLSGKNNVEYSPEFREGPQDISSYYGYVVSSKVSSNDFPDGKAKLYVYNEGEYTKYEDTMQIDVNDYWSPVKQKAIYWLLRNDITIGNRNFK